MSTLAQVMACCQPGPSHYLNQWWLIVKGFLWTHLRTIPQEVFMNLILNMHVEITLLKLLPHPSRASELNSCIFSAFVIDMLHVVFTLLCHLGHVINGINQCKIFWSESYYNTESTVFNWVCLLIEDKWHILRQQTKPSLHLVSAKPLSVSMLWNC